MIGSKRFFIYGIPIILFLILSFGYGFNGLFGQDSHAYYQYAMELEQSITSDIIPGEFYWPKLYPYLGAFFGLLGLPILITMRIISLLSLLGVLFFSNKIIKTIYNKDGNLWLLLSVVLSTYFIRGGMLVMSDMLATFFIVYCYWNFLKYLKDGKIGSFFLIICSAFIAFLTRYPSLPLTIVPVLIAFYSFSKKNKHNWLIILIGILLFLILFFINLNSINQIMIEFFERWSFKNIFSSSFHDKDGIINQWVPNIAYIFGNFFHIGYLALGVCLIPFYRKIKGVSFYILLGITFYLIFLSGFSTQNYRFLMLSHPLVIIILFPIFERFWDWLKTKKITALFLTGNILFCSFFFVYSFSKTFRVHKNEKAIVFALIELDSNKPIYSFYVDQSFPSYGIDNEIRNLYMEEYLDFEKGSLLVFNTDKFQTQWYGTNVMNNWNKVSTEYTLVELKSLTNNWKIYQIQ